MSPVPDLERAAAARARFLAQLPRGYRPWLHLAVPNLYGALLIAACATQLAEPTRAQWLTVPLTLVLAQAVEWRFHRDLLHRRVSPVQWLYDAHTVSHHAVYVRGAMTIREPRELRGILFPWWALGLITALMTPFALALGWLCGRDVGLLFLATTHAYVLLYEALHLAYHLPPRFQVLQRWPLRALAAHHAAHHDPRLMQRANFGVTSPLWDLVRGTRRP